jgi:hypothetical protein
MEEGFFENEIRIHQKLSLTLPISDMRFSAMAFAANMVGILPCFAV